MEELGRILREAREVKKLSIEQVSKDTKLTIRYIRAIEGGDVSVFKEDLTYLRYFLKAYCEYLEVDFEELKPMLKASIDEYTQTLSIEPLPKYEELSQKPRRVTRKKNEYNFKKGKKRRIDVSFVSLLSIIAMIFIGLLFIFTMYILPRMNDGAIDNNPSVPPVVETPGEEEEPPVEAVFETVITQNTANEYVVSGYNPAEPVQITLNFGSNSWLEARTNGIVLAEPKSQVYNVNDQIDFTVEGLVDEELTIRLGFFAGNTFKINGVSVTLDPALSNYGSAETIKFIFKGE